MTLFEIAALLIGLSAFFAYINHRVLHLPHTIGLVFMALAASLAIIALDALLPTVAVVTPLVVGLERIDFHETLMHGMLSFLLFAGAAHVNFDAFRNRASAIAVMATFGTLLSTVVVAVLMFVLLRLVGLHAEILWCLVFGALISPTDPVAVLGLFKTVKVPDTLEASMAGESLFNDGVGVVIFTVVVALAAGGAELENGAGGFIVEVFLREVLGGVILGGIAGWTGSRALPRIDDHEIEVLVSLALVMVTYAMAIRLEASGPIAIVVAGLLIGSTRRKIRATEAHDPFREFWTVIDGILNSVLFLLIGLEVIAVSRIQDHLAIALLAIPVCLVARLISLQVSLIAVRRRTTFPTVAVAVLTWGGLRGGIAVALALSLPDEGPRDIIISVTYAVVLFSIIVQGLTLQPLVRRIGASLSTPDGSKPN